MARTSNHPSITPRLVVIEGNDKGKVISLKQGTSVLGRSKADVIIQDPRISRSHVALHFDAKHGVVTATDLKSLNGTLLNGDPLTEGKIQDGDKLQIGDTVIDCHFSMGDETLASYQSLSDKSLSVRKEPKLEKKLPPESHPNLEMPPLAPPNPVTRIYQRIPSRVRVVLLAALLITVYFSSVSTGPQKQVETLERQITSVRQLELTGKLEEAVTAAEEIAKSHPGDSRAFLLLGDVYVQQRRTEGAIAAYQKGHELTPNIPVLHIRLAQQYFRSGFFNEGREEVRHLDSTLTNGKENDDTKNVFIGLAQLYLEFREELKQPSERLLIISRALQSAMASDTSIGYRMEAEVHFQEKRYSEAQNALARALKSWPKDEDVLNQMVRIKIYSEDVKGAEETVQNWIEVNPQATRPLIVMALLKSNQKNFVAALLSLQKVVQLLAKTPQEPDYGQALHSMGLIYLEQRQVADAKAAFRQACDVGVETSCKQPILQEGVAAPEEPQNPPRSPGSQTPAGQNPNPAEAPAAGRAVPQ